MEAIIGVMVKDIEVLKMEEFLKKN